MTNEGNDFCSECGRDYDAMTEEERDRHVTEGEYVLVGCRTKARIDAHLTAHYDDIGQDFDLMDGSDDEVGHELADKHARELNLTDAASHAYILESIGVMLTH